MQYNFLSSELVQRKYCYPHFISRSYRRVRPELRKQTQTWLRTCPRGPVNSTAVLTAAYSSSPSAAERWEQHTGSPHGLLVKRLALGRYGWSAQAIHSAVTAG